MSKSKSKSKLKKLREGSRAIGMSAINRSGSGAHVPKDQKRQSNKKNDWLYEHVG